MRLHFFASETTRAVQAALLAGEQDGVDGYILDLRNNPGDHAVIDDLPLSLIPTLTFALTCGPCNCSSCLYSRS